MKFNSDIVGGVIAWSAVAGLIMLAKPLMLTSHDVETEAVEMETVAASYAADITTSEELLEYIPEIETETRADIEYYLERWSFAERADEMSMDLSGTDIAALQKVAIAEAGVDGVEGEALVMRVVLNRVYSDEFPDTVLEVISQDNQFTTYSNGSYEAAEPDGVSNEAWSMVESGWDESQGALYFEKSTNESTWHSENLTYLFTYGGHDFYTE